MSDVLHFAFEYFDRGWSLIPLVGKQPPSGFGWKRFQSERATIDDIKCWFRLSTDGFNNIGVVTGDVSGITVVDCDTPADAEWWSKNFPCSPLVAHTGRGGAHVYYRAHPNSGVVTAPTFSGGTSIFAVKVDMSAARRLFIRRPMLSTAGSRGITIPSPRYRSSIQYGSDQRTTRGPISCCQHRPITRVGWWTNTLLSFYLPKESFVIMRGHNEFDDLFHD